MPDGDSDTHSRGIPLTPWTGTPPRDVVPNENEPLGSVGPNVEPGFGDTHAIYPAVSPPPQAQAWQGWPVGWGVPTITPPIDFDWAGGVPPPAYRRRVSTFGSCIDLNARTLAGMPAIRYVGNTPAEPPPWTITPEPNVYAHWGDFLRALVVCMQARGEAILIATTSYAPDVAQQAAGRPGWPRTFYVAQPDAIRIEPNSDHTAWEYSWSRTGALIDTRPVGGVLCHIRYLTVAGRAHGVGPLEWAYENLRSAGALSEYGADLADRGGVPWGVIKSKVNLGATGAQRLQDQWVQGAANRHGAPAVMTGDFDLETLTLDPKSMALLELREFDEKRICGAFGVPPHLLGLETGGSMDYTSTGTSFDQHWRQGLKPMAENISRALSNWALPRGQSLVLDPQAYVEPDLYQRTQAYQMQFAAGVLTVDEWRHLEGRGPLSAAPATPAMLPGGITP